MELVSFAKEVVQNVAEHAVSYRVGQTALRYIDRALWVVEKCARWAVPPPLDQDDTPQPELVRPLPWVFFLGMLITLRITRESISLVNLILGKPPLRSADVVMYIQSKRRYLRTLKYQGNRMIRARAAPRGEPWYSGLQALFEFTMCFRRSHNYGNNNTTRVSNNDEVLVVKHGKPTREATGTGPSSSEITMERLIEKMMVDLNADSDDDSSFTLTNATSVRSDTDSDTEREDLGNHNNDTVITSVQSGDSLNDTNVDNNVENNVDNNVDNNASPNKPDFASSTPEKSVATNKDDSPKETSQDAQKSETEIGKVPRKERDAHATKAALSEPSITIETPSKTESLLKSPRKEEKLSPKTETQTFLQSEKCSPSKQPSKQSKFVNGRTMSVPNKNKGLMNQRRNTDVADTRVAPADEAI
ncbi:suppressor of Mek1-like isoform X2 [Pectinophora gossypiella]|uniref:suppressor of Mek1-like isoform X2 n=1 Tax=Pectinophora gossypiella TaxID=13191 RepID=UPI00214E49F8|nr:suppressor of Mek1-like isoform X2 [Pectinophora gossypiella]